MVIDGCEPEGGARAPSFLVLAPLVLVPLLAGLVLLPPAARAGDAKAGQTKAAMCVTCHGPIGLSQAPDAPHLAGQPEIYLTTQLAAYRDGKRQHEVMQVVTRDLSDADIDDLAAWYGSIRVSAEPP